MCGIAGRINTDGRPADRSVLQAMATLLGHRGRDESGVLTNDNVGLAHARLTIIDLASGPQPMANGDRSIWISFNGEIFNYPELRQELRQKGWRFTTNSDTEILLHLYEQEGLDCVQRLNGQWAFAIWDARARRLMLSRHQREEPAIQTTARSRYPCQHWS
jgi:asparagine synthase (glutamine-hydrolysing)